MSLGDPEYAVASGRLDESIRTISAGGEHYRVAAVPTADGRALVLAQSLESQEQVLNRLGPVMLLFGLAGVVGAAAAGWAVARNGLRPVRRLTSAVEEIARTEELAPLPIDGDDEIARLATAFNAMLAALGGLSRPPAPAGRRRRPRAADAAHVAAHQPGPAHPGRRDRRAAARAEGRAARTTSAPSSRSCRRSSATWSSSPATSRSPTSWRASTSPRWSTGPSRGSGCGRREASSTWRPCPGGWWVSRAPSSARSPTCSTTPPSGDPRTAPSRCGSRTAC